MAIQSFPSGMKSLKLSTSGQNEFFAADHLRELHSLFEYEDRVEFSGIVNLEKDVLQFKKHIGPSSHFPWGPQIVFHTHFRSIGAELFSVTDLFLFACAPASVSLLFSEFQISMLEKKKTNLQLFSMLRSKLETLKIGGHLRKNSPMNSCYFNSILERKFPKLKRIITHSQRIDFIIHTFGFKFMEFKL